jgi:cytochrome c-type biogenesis protein CcmH
LKYLRFLLLFLVVVAAPVSAQAPSFQELEESLTCQCGCGLTVHSCNHLQCGSAIPLRQEIREQMSLGKDKQEILAHFAAKYGEKILSAPTTTGFNLAAWAMPFLMVTLGGIFVMATLWRWTRRSAAAAAVAAAAPPPAETPGSVPSAHERILERELGAFDE